MLQFEVRIPKAQFAAGAAQNAGLDIDFLVPGSVSGTKGNLRNLVKSITIVSEDNHSWELWAYSSAARNLAGAGSSDNTKFLGKWKFAASDGGQRSNDANNFWTYYIDGNDIPVRDDDNTGKLHLTLIDRTAGGLGAGKNISIELRLQPVMFP